MQSLFNMKKCDRSSEWLRNLISLLGSSKRVWSPEWWCNIIFLFGMGKSGPTSELRCDVHILLWHWWQAPMLSSVRKSQHSVKSSALIVGATVVAEQMWNALIVYNGSWYDISYVSLCDDRNLSVSDSSVPYCIYQKSDCLCRLSVVLTSTPLRVLWI